MLKSKYELILVLDPGCNEEEVEKEISAVEATVGNHDGSILSKSIWGRKELAYLIRKKKHGIYIELQIEANPEFVGELERQFKINDKVLRFLTVSKDKFAPDLIRTEVEEGAAETQAE